MQMATVLVISSATAMMWGMGSNGRPRKSRSRPATMTRLPRSANWLITSTIPESKNWASSMPTTSVRGWTRVSTSAELRTISAL